jgi:nucleoside-diphosphate-sugar epimerase
MACYIVTGCAGFIASRVAHMLLQESHTVIGIDNLNDSCDIRLKRWRLQQLEPFTTFTFHQLDICDRPALSAVFTDQIDGIINLAARAGVRQSVANPWVYVETNLTGTLNLLELCRTHNIPKFILASTSSLYGANNPRPFREDANTDGPLSPYAATKKAAEAMCYTYHYLTGIDITVFRFFTVYGPAGRPDMSPFRFVQWISEGRTVTVFGDGQQSRDFTYVDDIARGCVAGLKPLGYEIINLGSDKPVGLMDFLHLIEEMTGKQANIAYKPRHAADMLHTWADISKAEQLLGWRPQTTLRQGVQHMGDWYRQNQEWAHDIPNE